MSIPQLIPLEINYATQRDNVITNIVKMLIERGSITRNLNDMINFVKLHMRSDETCSITIDKPARDDTMNYKIILLMTQSIATIQKSIVGEHINKNKGDHLIFVVDSITQRALQNINDKYDNIEVFTNSQMMINLVEHVYVPKHILLSDSEAQKIIDDYGTNKSELPKMFVSDPVAKYFNAKVGQIFKIIRPSEMTCESVYYRVVVRSISTKKK